MRIWGKVSGRGWRKMIHEVFMNFAFSIAIATEVWYSIGKYTKE